MSNLHLSAQIGSPDITSEPIRKGFGRGLKQAGDEDQSVVALCADLTESTQMHLFRDAHPERFVEIGVAEQNLVTVAAGMSAMGKKPFASSYAAFSPGRNWEQIRTTICLNERFVCVVGSHAGISVGPDGATHQMLEDIALMRVLPHMIVIAPGDSIEAEKATLAIARQDRPTYLRLAREATPVFTTAETPFTIGQAYVLREGTDITLLGTGTMSYQCLVAADTLAKHGISAEVVHVPTIKPLDSETILASLKKTGRAITVEEAQIAGGFGSAICELAADKLPIPIRRLGIQDRFGESGKPNELLEHFGLTGEHIASSVQDFIKTNPQYHQGA
ncbi:MAG: transketolase C-terminal domain-containing protein [Candidatus Saccharimonadales bacterium]|jgi:transketolase